ncbi:hypothetical protein CJ344_24115 [Salmonella enterica]|nr:hypothetical protein [Salmonella enterica]
MADTSFCVRYLRSDIPLRIPSDYKRYGPVSVLRFQAKRVHRENPDGDKNCDYCHPVQDVRKGEHEKPWGSRELCCHCR